MLNSSEFAHCLRKYLHTQTHTPSRKLSHTSSTSEHSDTYNNYKHIERTQTYRTSIYPSISNHSAKYFFLSSFFRQKHSSMCSFSPFLWPLPPSQGCLGLEAKACWEQYRQTGWRCSSGCRGRCLGYSAARRRRVAAEADSRWAGGSATCSSAIETQMMTVRGERGWQWALNSP